MKAKIMVQSEYSVGRAIFFTDVIEKYIPPKKGKQHILRIIRELVDFKPKSKGTNIGLALQTLTSVIKKRSIAFVISDFIGTNYEDALKIANQKHDLVALRISDPAEGELPNVGLIKIKDSETGAERWVDTSNNKARMAYGQWWKDKNVEIQKLFNKTGIDFTTLHTDRPYVQPLMQLFKKRGQK